jgi:hypothetical protein
MDSPNLTAHGGRYNRSGSTTRVRTAYLDELALTLREANAIIEREARNRPALEPHLWRLAAAIAQTEIALNRSLRATAVRKANLSAGRIDGL